MSGWVGNIHIYREPGQPMTDYRDPHLPENINRFKTPPYKLFYCHNCGRLRAAKDLNIHVYYDHSSVVCRERQFARSPEFPFAYERVCLGYTFDAVHGRG